MKFEDFWYVVALSNQLRSHTVLSRTVLDEWLVLFRDQEGQAVALRDRCMHRNNRLSTGRVHQGCLQCSYHGWTYRADGQVVSVPAEGNDFQASHCRRAKQYSTCEQDGYIYVRLAEAPNEELVPFAMPYYQQPGWETVRVINRFRSNVTNCAENFIDIPHTAFVHPGVFRTARQQRLEMAVTRRDGSIFIEYQQETTNLGWYTRFLNYQGQPIQHNDRFHMPNVTCVEYRMGRNRHLFITSQSIPETEQSTLVYTDVTYNYGMWNKVARPFVHWTAQHIIQQDVEVLGTQCDTIAKYGAQFSNTPADTIHLFVESIRSAIAAGDNPRNLPEKTVHLKFWV